MQGFSKKLIDWYQLNKRDLPWRHTTDPYKIWLSEIMLQQTRVEQGLPYYSKFLTLFPTVFILASASEEQVLNAWKGLGYYSRARRLHQTAKLVVEANDGVFPGDFEGLKKLPGVGNYTAAAIASFCFNEKVPVVDGNVYRVLARLFNVENPIDDLKGQKLFFKLASELIDSKHPATFNQAIMEFGALQCVPKKLNCQPCPFLSSCEAFNLKRTDELPVKKRKVKRRSRYFTYLIVKKDEKYLTVKRGGDEIWANMFEFPMIETSDYVIDKKSLSSLKISTVPFDFNVNTTSDYRKHVLTHQDIFYTFWEVSINSSLTEEYVYFSESKLNDLPFPKLLENFISNL